VERLRKYLCRDSCLVYDLDTDAVFFENPKEEVVEYDMDTDLVECTNKNPKQFNQLVTPNHRMPVIHRDNRQVLKIGTLKAIVPRLPIAPPCTYKWFHEGS